MAPDGTVELGGVLLFLVKVGKNGFENGSEDSSTQAGLSAVRSFSLMCF